MRVPYITAENAVALAKLKAAKYAAKKLEGIKPVEPATEPAEADEFRRKRLARVRAQLDRLDAMLNSETDPGKLDRLASCAIRLNEQERQLSNRSLPPTLKANSPARPRKNSGAIPDPTD